MIDWERVSELKEEIGEEDFSEVAELFMSEVEDVLERLRHAPDPARFEEDLHFLKSSALNLGFSDFSNLCQAGEKCAAQGEAASVDLAPIFTSYDATKAIFVAA